MALSDIAPTMALRASSLPPECIRCIVSQLDGDIHALFKLLTVHSTFFHATVPVLYRDPFRALEGQIRQQALMYGRNYWPSFASSLPAKQLLYLLLLSCRRADDLAPFLTPDWPNPISPLTAEQPLKAVYIDYLEDLDYGRWKTTLKLLAPEVDATVEPLLVRLMRLLFLDHHQERIQVLSIPITHMEPYRAYIPHLKSLQRIHFYEDELDGLHDQDEDQGSEQDQDQQSTDAGQNQELHDRSGDPDPDQPDLDQTPQDQLENRPMEAASITQEAEVTGTDVQREVGQAGTDGQGVAEATRADLQGDIELEGTAVQSEAEEARTNGHGEIEVSGTDGQAEETTVEGGAEVVIQDEVLTLEGGLEVEAPAAEHIEPGEATGVQSETEEARTNGQGEVEVSGTDGQAEETTVEGGAEVAVQDEVLTLEGGLEVEAPAAEHAEPGEAAPEGEQEEGQDAAAAEQEGEEQGENEDGAAQTTPVHDPTPRAVSFIQSHRALFNPSRVEERLYAHDDHHLHLKELPCGYGLVEVEPPRYWIHPGWSADLTHDARYIQLLGALESPVHIDFDNWKMFSYQLDKISLEGVKRLRSFCNDMPEATWDQGKLLQRCRGLERFSATLRSPTVFAWAVEEQKDRATYESLCQSGVACAPTSLAQGRSHGGYFGPGLDPVPLRRVTFRNGDDTYVMPVLKDVCTAFNKTLELIKVQLYAAEGEIPLGIVYGMPHLTSLDIRINFSCHFVSNASFLQGCRALEYLRLMDSNSSDLDSTATAVQEPWVLPRLRVLSITGAVCDSFNYESLANSPDLETVRLDNMLEDIGVRKVSERNLDYLSRPAWSWSWSLPRLRSMMLRGLSAHLFRPSLLEGCPKLERLHLDLDQVARSVSSCRDLTDSPLKFHSPVRTLVLKGRWIMTETPDLFRMLMQTWFNGLLYLKMDASEFPSNMSIMSGLKSMTGLCKAVLRRHCLSNYEAWELGLQEVDFKCSREWDLKHRVDISRADARKRRLLAREQQREEEVRELERAKKLLEFQDSVEIMSTAFTILGEMEEVPNVPSGQEEEHRNQSRTSTHPEAVDGAINQAPEQSQEQGQEQRDETEVRQDEVDVRQDEAEVQRDEAEVQRDEAEVQRELAEQEALEKQEAEEDYLDILRTVYVFKGKRFHSVLE